MRKCPSEDSKGDSSERNMGKWTLTGFKIQGDPNVPAQQISFQVFINIFDSLYCDEQRWKDGNCFNDTISHLAQGDSTVTPTLLSQLDTLSPSRPQEVRFTYCEKYHAAQ